MADESMKEQVQALLRVEHFDEVARERIVALGSDALIEVKRCATGSSRGESGFMKGRAILALADWPEVDVLDTLEEVLDQTNLDNRMRATMTLGEIGSDAAVQRLAAFADRADNDLELSSVARALGVVEQSTARDALETMRDRTTSAAVIADIDEALTD